eukprot:s2196_g21.t1
MTTYLKELGWEAQGPRHWSISGQTYDVASAEGLHAVVWHLKNAIQQQRWTAVAATPGAEDAVNGIDWQAAKKAVKHLAPLEKTAVQTLWQAALKAGPEAFCQRCQAEASLQHVLYDCAMWAGHAPPPLSILSMQAQGCYSSLWLRGLPAKRAFYVVDSSTEIKGVWPVPDLTGVRFATDATGPKDPRDGPVLWSVIAFRVLEGDEEGDLRTGQIQVVGSITGAVSHEQTVFRGEAAAVCETVRAHPGEDELDITLDCEGVLRRIHRRNPGHSNRDLLDPVDSFEPARRGRHVIYTLLIRRGNAQWPIRRRFRQVVKLHEQLLQGFGRSSMKEGLPRLPPKLTYRSIFCGQQDQRFLQVRAVQLQEYFEALLRYIPYVDQCEALREFLCSVDVSNMSYDALLDLEQAR